MTLARITSAAFSGLDPLPVEVEVDTRPGGEQTSIVLVGLPDAAVREAKDRVLAALRNCGHAPNQLHITVNLAPAHLRKEGVLYDLPIAAGLLHSMGVITEEYHHDYLIVGELGLSGELRPIHGAIAIAMLARSLGKKGLILPAANANEAAAVPDLDIIPVTDLNDLIAFLSNPLVISPLPPSLSEELFATTAPLVDFADVKGQENAKRALEIAAAGGHNILLSGPPGAGKSMMAKSLPGIMPELTVEEALEVTKIHSVAGLLSENETVITRRPFRSPHHTVSFAGLIGGGSYPRPGEVSLAHRGILFLDELPEFARSVLEVMRQPLEDREVTISRANGNYTFPASFLCIAAMNPCPCGNLGHPDKQCKCSVREVERYRSRLSGPLLDRLDIHLDIPPLNYDELTSRSQGEPSFSIRERVVAAREIQRKRFGSCRTNALMSSREVRSYCAVDREGESMLRFAIDQKGISARAYDRILRVARTIADLMGCEEIEPDHLMEAIHYRTGVDSAATALV